MGGKRLGEADSSSVEVILPDGFGTSFTDQAIQGKFIRKVYLILLSQLTLTAGIVSTFIFVPAIKRTSAKNPIYIYLSYTFP